MNGHPEHTVMINSIDVECPNCDTSTRIYNFVSGRVYRCAGHECNTRFIVKYEWSASFFKIKKRKAAATARRTKRALPEKARQL